MIIPRHGLAGSSVLPVLRNCCRQRPYLPPSRPHISSGIGWAKRKTRRRSGATPTSLSSVASSVWSAAPAGPVDAPIRVPLPLPARLRVGFLLIGALLTEVLLIEPLVSEP